MKQIHNIRVRVHNADKAIVEEIIARADAMARRNEEDRVETSITEEDGLVIGELWLDRQQPVRKFFGELHAMMSESDKERIRTNATRYLDTGTHCFFHLDRKQFSTGACVITDKPAGAVNIRLNIACWPANKDNAAKTLQELFA